MLEIRLHCEHCDKSLPNESDQAMICSYECTFCQNCVETLLQNVCPNCGGGFEKRPTRPNAQLDKHPCNYNHIYKPVVENKYFEKNNHIHPRNR